MADGDASGWLPAGQGDMFNGLVFSADTITPRLISGHLTEYRRVVAQMELPELLRRAGRAVITQWAGCCTVRVVWWWGGDTERR